MTPIPMSTDPSSWPLALRWAASIALSFLVVAPCVVVICAGCAAVVEVMQ